MKELTKNYKEILLLVFMPALNVFLSVFFIAHTGTHFKDKLFFEKDKSIKEAMFYHKTDHGVSCELCPRKCYLPEGFRGKCRVRINSGGKLYAMSYAKPSAINVDPIEKKPVFHLKPGTRSFSIATKGCNLRCSFCQNWALSQFNPEESNQQIIMPQQIVELAKKNNCASISYTYSEPVTFYEYVYDTACIAKSQGIYNVLVSAGYIEKEPLEKLLPYFDIIKIDLKGFNDKFYKNIVGCDLKHIEETLKTIKQNGKIVEVVNLVVPGLNDEMEEIKEMSRWIAEEMGPDTPLFFSRFYPNYLLTNLPATDIVTLEKAHDIAVSQGLLYVYLGNVPGHKYENTYCSRCGKILVERYGYTILGVHIKKDGKCEYCGYKIPGIW
ncbi:MAG TPA: AmmeMemoRadiSam system radical SAM enzyme [Candidatus Goldiibacteriota bacterium]|nr:AmmeMemoRadiSam system radical SAM enzyme [Candidatus Goldiibacteriota bacterium]